MSFRGNVLPFLFAPPLIFKRRAKNVVSGLWREKHLSLRGSIKSMPFVVALSCAEICDKNALFKPFFR